VLGAESLKLSRHQRQTHNTTTPPIPHRTTHSLALSHLACIVCIVGVRERGIAPFLAFITDNGFKSVCQMTWVYSITQPHPDVHRNLILILITHL